MASIEIGSLSQYFDQEEIDAFLAAFSEADVELELEDVEDDADGRLIEGDIDDDVFADFLDRLDANGAACDVYVPSDFEDVVEAAGSRLGSAHALMLVLDELRDDIFEEEEEAEEVEVTASDEDDEEFTEFEDDEPEAHFGGQSELNIQDEQIRHLWKTLYKCARVSIRDKLCVFVRR